MYQTNDEIESSVKQRDVWMTGEKGKRENRKGRGGWMDGWME